MAGSDQLDRIEAQITDAVAEFRRFRAEGYHSQEELYAFMQQMSLRSDRIAQGQTELMRSTVTELRTHSEKMRKNHEEQLAEQRAQRGALLAILDRLGGGPAPPATS